MHIKTVSRKTPFKLLRWIGVLCLSFTVPLLANEIHVNSFKMVEGNGSLANPFSSFDQALEKSRSIQGKEKVIRIHGTGTLFLTKTIKLDERDSSLKIRQNLGSSSVEEPK
jgi:hypothetical protein